MLTAKLCNQQSVMKRFDSYHYSCECAVTLDKIACQMHKNVTYNTFKQIKINQCITVWLVMFHCWIFLFSILIFLALRNSKTGSLPVSEIYSFMTEHFPYFKVNCTTASQNNFYIIYLYLQWYLGSLTEACAWLMWQIQNANRVI